MSDEMTLALVSTMGNKATIGGADGDIPYTPEAMAAWQAAQRPSPISLPEKVKQLELDMLALTVKIGRIETEYQQVKRLLNRDYGEF